MGGRNFYAGENDLVKGQGQDGLEEWPAKTIRECLSGATTELFLSDCRDQVQLENVLAFLEVDRAERPEALSYTLLGESLRGE